MSTSPIANRVNATLLKALQDMVLEFGAFPETKRARKTLEKARRALVMAERAVSANTRRRYKYLPCKDSPDGKHQWSRFHHNDFDNCNLCGEPRFAMRERAASQL